MANFQRNNLDQASSPYLQQHKDNPIWWQEWDKETLDYAKKKNKLIFVSIGYATCHWCHVMAEDAFSSQVISDELNRHFVSIKVDREERPDLDQYFMDFATRTTGQGGWPLNVILSPEGKPFFAGTYFPVEPRDMMPGFTKVLEEARRWYEEHQEDLMEFQLIAKEPKELALEEGKILDTISRLFDKKHGGFGTGAKFPPHSTLLYLMHYFDLAEDEALREMITKTLDAMSFRGLHDHLQGGFYRYCVDGKWTISHFEKMLYDQAMHLWVYSTAYKLFNRSQDKIIAQKLIQCLEETFEDQGLFYSAHDADTDHEEGGTYLWTMDELKSALTAEELESFQRVFDVSEKGNLEGKNHLVKKSDEFLPEIEQKLLKAREKRPQPFMDQKIVTGHNALIGIGLVLAHRFVGIKKALAKAQNLFDQLIKLHFVNKKLAHSSIDGKRQEQEFLEDYASVLLLATYLNEETDSYRGLIKQLLDKIDRFFDEQWYANVATDDFARIPASLFDHPIPSPVSLAEFARFRARRILEIQKETTLSLQPPHQRDFYNSVVLFAKGNLHEIHAPKTLDWNQLPLNSMQIRGTRYQDCFRFKCKEFKTQQALIKELRD